MGKLDGKVAVVTGGASGIGEGVVRHFVDEGARVVIADIQVEAGRSLAAELEGSAVFSQADVTREGDVAASVARAVDAFGRLDVMYNNAGGYGARGSILEIDEAGFDATAALLLKSVFFGMKHAGRILAEQGSGTILSTASIAGLSAGAGPHLYSTFKASVIQLTKSVAIELGEKGVRVNCICPGGVVTPLVLGSVDGGEEAVQGVRAYMSKTQPIGRPGEPLDVARAAAWLASDDADYVTGQAVAVDGGESLGRRWSKQLLK